MAAINPYKPSVLFVGHIGKQCRSGSDAAQRGVWSGSALFAYVMLYLNLNSNEKY